MLRSAAEKPWFEVVGLVDVDANVVTKAQAGWPGAQGFSDLATAIAQTDADAVLVNTPSELHFGQAKDALEAGLHVLVAKPITNGFDEACELVDLADERDVKLCVGHQIRFLRHYRAVERFVASGRLGSVEMINFVNPKPRPNPLNLAKLDQPALYELSCHHFDSLLAIVPGNIPLSIACDGFEPSWSTYAGPTMVNASIRFSDGLHVLYQGGLSAQAENYELRLEGSAGALRCRGIHMSNDTMTNEFAEPGGPFAPAEIDEGIPVADPWDEFFDRWQQYLSGGDEPSFSGRNNLKAFALLSAAIDSIEAGGAPVEVAGNERYAEAFPDRQASHA